MNPMLPCGHVAEDDGDRYYLDVCFTCGWKSDYRRKRDAENSVALAEARAEQKEQT